VESTYYGFRGFSKMPRTIIRPTPKGKGLAAEAPPPSENTDNFLAKLAKYIPAEINAAFVGVYGIMKGITNFPTIGQWIIFFVFLILAPLYLYYVAKKENQKPDIAQIAISPFAFAIWVFAIGGPFALYTWYVQAYGAILLIVATLAIPMVDFFITQTTH
jgi:FtsH-binding integral membrane protein